jgi:hypothetical protein
MPLLSPSRSKSSSGFAAGAEDGLGSASCEVPKGWEFRGRGDNGQEKRRKPGKRRWTPIDPSRQSRYRSVPGSNLPVAACVSGQSSASRPPTFEKACP